MAPNRRALTPRAAAATGRMCTSLTEPAASVMGGDVGPEPAPPGPDEGEALPPLLTAEPAPVAVG